jgi:uncharacterized protein (TIGR00255 family)
MILSMTGYGAATVQTEALAAAATARSVNHRFLDVAVHLPRRLAALEADLKRLVQGRLSRGRVELALEVRGSTETGARVVGARDLIAEVVRALREVKAEHGLAGDVSIAEVARFPGAFEVVEEAGTIEDGPRQELLALAAQALAQLLEMRQAEGAKIEAALRQELAAMEAAVQRIEALSAGEKAVRRDLLLARLRELRDEVGLEDVRLYQEAVRGAEKMDVAEEVQRLRSHIAQAREALAGPGPCGKRLDFVAQELGREANTIGSKVQSSSLASEVVNLKSQIERLREQVQNVE